MRKHPFYVLFIIIMMSACVNNVEVQVPEIPEDEISYASQIQPIFNNSCGGSSCHTNGGMQGNVNLSSYQTAIASVGSQYGTEVIQPGDADNSPLVDKLGTNPDFGNRMPPGGSLSGEQVGQIIAWINQGARNN